jgi:hypothetical protein
LRVEEAAQGTLLQGAVSSEKLEAVLFRYTSLRRSPQCPSWSACSRESTPTPAQIVNGTCDVGTLCGDLPDLQPDLMISVGVLVIWPAFPGFRKRMAETGTGCRAR